MRCNLSLQVGGIYSRLFSVRQWLWRLILTSIGINAQNDVIKIWNYDSSAGWTSFEPGGR